MTMEAFLTSLYWSLGYTVFGFIIYFILKNINKKLFDTKQKNLNKTSHTYKKLETLEMTIKNIIKYVVIIVTILMILSRFGVDVSSFVAGLGIAGVLAGLALQDFMKDIIGGASILLENQFSIGDTISIGDFKGEVVAISLKTTKIKNYDGSVKIIANRNVTDVVNYNISPSRAIVDVSVAYEENLDKVEKILNSLVKDMSKTLPNLKGEVEILGVNSLDDSSVIYRLTVLTVSMEHYNVERIMRKMIKDCFDKEQIKIPYPQVEVHNGK